MNILDSIICAVTGNLSSSHFASPSSADITDNLIIKAGLAMKHNQSESFSASLFNPRRYLILFKAYIGYAPKGLWTPDEAIAFVRTSAADFNRKLIFLSPSLTVIRSSCQLTLQHDRNWKLQGLQFNTKATNKMNTMRFSFSTDEEAAEWEAAINRELLPENCLPDGFIKKVQFQINSSTSTYDYLQRFHFHLWDYILSGEFCVMRFYLNMRALEGDGCVTMILIRLLNQAMFLQKTTIVDPELLSFYIFFSLQKASSLVVLLFAHINMDSGSLSQDIKYYIKKLLSCLDNKDVDDSLLRLFEYPIETRHEWPAIKDWYASAFSNAQDRAPLRITQVDIDKMLENPVLLLQIFTENFRGGHTSSKQIRFILDGLSLETLTNPFEYSWETSPTTTGAYFTRLIFSLDHDDIQSVISADRLKFSVFFRALLREGCHSDEDALEDAVSTFMFDYNNSYPEQDFSHKFMDAITDAASILAIELVQYDQSVRIEMKCLFITFVLRMEYCNQRKFSYSESFTASIAYIGSAEYLDKLVALMETLDFGKYLGELVMSRLSTIYKAAAPSQPTPSKPAAKGTPAKPTRRSSSYVELDDFLTPTDSSSEFPRKVSATDISTWDEDSDITDASSDLLKKGRPDDFSSSIGGVCIEEVDIELTFHQVKRNYSKPILEDVILGLFNICLRSKTGGVVLRRFLYVNRKLFQTFMKKDEEFRKKTIHLFQELFNLSKDLVDYMNKDYLLNEARHFQQEALNLLKEAKDFSTTVVLALHLHNYASLVKRSDDFKTNLQVDHDRKVDFLQHVSKAILSRKAEQLGALSLEDISSCINDAMNALSVLGTDQIQEAKSLKALFRHHLKADPENWRSLFNGTLTIALFIKYLFREDYKLAYTVFQATNSSNDEFLCLLVEVMRSHHTSPLIDNETFKQTLEEGSVSQAAIDELYSRIKISRSTHDQGDVLMTDVFIAWMQNRFEQLSIPMPPRNTQIITVLVCSRWAYNLLRGSSGNEKKTLIAQVGTGEGKSLIIAMASIYIVRELKLEVHVMEHNAGLLKKDYSQFADFYKKFDIKCFSGFDRSNSDISVTYCLRGHHRSINGLSMEHYYREKIYSGESPFGKSVLICDEVDSLIIDEDDLSCYVKGTTDSPELRTAFDAVKSRGSKPVSCSKKIWQHATSAAATANGKRAGIDYLVSQGGELTLLDNGKPMPNLVCDWLEYLRYCQTPGYCPSLHMRFYTQSMVHMISQYKFILGFSGSIGSPSEQQFLRDNFSAWSFITPSFLDTCNDLTHGPPNLVHDSVYIFEDESKQLAAVAKLAVSKCASVPVIVIAHYNETKKYIKAITTEINKHGDLLAGRKPTEFIQEFTEFDPVTNQPTNSLAIVESATALVSAGALNKGRRITVTDPYGGRGHDYMVKEDNETVDDNGGVLVIVTFIPDSEREFIQWKGRTARSDRKGQYAMMLSSSDASFQSSSELLLQHKAKDWTDEKPRYSPGLINSLLLKVDSALSNQMKQKEGKLKRMKQINELCDHYYLTYRHSDGGSWPSVEFEGKDKILIDFLEGHWNANLDHVKDRLGLHYRSLYG